MKSVLDFLYFGEASVEQDDVQQFIGLAQDLQIKGFKFSDYVTNVSEVKIQKVNSGKKGNENNSENSINSPKYNNPKNDQDNRQVTMEPSEIQENDVIENHLMEDYTEKFVTQEKFDESMKLTIDQSSYLVELENKRERLVIKLEGNKFQCEECWKIFTRKDHLKVHSDVHFPQYSYPCKYCGKMNKTRETLRGHTRYHIRNNETQMLSYLPEVIFHQD